MPSHFVVVWFVAFAYILLLLVVLWDIFIFFILPALRVTLFFIFDNPAAVKRTAPQQTASRCMLLRISNIICISNRSVYFVLIWKYWHSLFIF